MNMQYGKDGLEITKHFEGCKLTAYRDGGGVLTNGYGNTHRVVEGSTITQEQAEADLLANVADAVDTVNDHVTVPLSQEQFDSLVDFTFNCGPTAFKTSTLLRKLNAGDYEGAAREFLRWNKDNGIVVAGLTRRREAESALFKDAA